MDTKLNNENHCNSKEKPTVYAYQNDSSSLRYNKAMAARRLRP